MVLDASLLNTQHYKVRIKGKVEQSREGVAPSPTPWCSSYRKGNLRVTLDYGRQLYLLTCLIRNSDFLLSLAMKLIDLLRSFQFWPRSDQQIQSSFLIRRIIVRLLRCYICVIIILFIQLISNFLHRHRVEASVVNAQQYSMPFPNFWMSVSWQSAAFCTVLKWLLINTKQSA